MRRFLNAAFWLSHSMLFGSTWTRSEWRLWDMVTGDFGVYVLDAVGFSCRCVVLTLQKCSLRLRCRGALVRFGMRNFPATLWRRDGVGHISVHGSLLHGCSSTANVESECAISDGNSTSTNSPGQRLVDSEGARTMCVLRTACLCISVSENWYWNTESFPMSTWHREGRIAMSLFSMNGMPV